MKNVKIDIKELLKKQDFVIGAAVVILSLIVGYKIYTDKTNQVKNLNMNIREEQQKNEVHSGIGTLDTEIEKYMPQSAISSNAERTALIDTISSKAAEYNLSIDTISFAKEEEKEFLNFVPIQMELSGKYHNFGKFIASLENLEKMLKVSDVKIMSPQKNRYQAATVQADGDNIQKFMVTVKAVIIKSDYQR